MYLVIFIIVGIYGQHPHMAPPGGMYPSKAHLAPGAPPPQGAPYNPQSYPQGK